MVVTSTVNTHDAIRVIFCDFIANPAEPNTVIDVKNKLRFCGGDAAKTKSMVSFGGSFHNLHNG